MSHSSKKPTQRLSIFISSHLALFILFILFSSSVTVFYFFQAFQKDLIESSALAEAKTLANTITSMRDTYSKKVVKNVNKSKTPVVHNFEDVPGSIPLPTTFTIELSNNIAQRSHRGLNVKLYSPFPFPWRKGGGLRDSFSKKAWTALNKDPNKPYYSFEKKNNELVLRYAKADILSSSCIGCHNERNDSPKNDWKVGQIRGIFEITTPISNAVAITKDNSSNLIILMTIIGLTCITMITIALREHGNSKLVIEETNKQLKSKNYTLEQQQNQLLQASQLKNEFMARMSHELRTPMHGVLGMAEILSTSELNEKQTKFVKSIQTSGNRLLDLITDILEYSHVEAGQIQLNIQPFNLPMTLGHIFNTLKPQADEKALQLISDFDSSIPDVLLGDDNRIRQILLNLIGNAIKFTPKGEVKVSVEVKATSDTSTQIHFSIADTGIGIDKEKVEHLFRAFEQADNTATREFAGTGLGLTISQRFVNLMGSKISVKSSLNEGSNFYFDLNFEMPIDNNSKTEN